MIAGGSKVVYMYMLEEKEAFTAWKAVKCVKCI